MSDDDGSSIISHFSHGEHELVKRHYIGPGYLCDMCWEDLSGPAYGCPAAGCDFAIHDTCAAHPQTLLSPDHHPHELVLAQTPRRDDDDGAARFSCDVCAGACASGCFLYRCPPCNFDMHPRCVRLPPVVRSTRHGEHDLTLVAAATDDDEGQRRRCAACHEGGAWYYHCTVCSDLDFHVSCAAGGGGGAAENAAAAGGDPAGELLLARINAQRDINYKIAVANIQARGFAAAADLAGDYHTRRFYY